MPSSIRMRRSAGRVWRLPPVGKHLWGTVAMGTKGQIVIPKAARDTFHLSEGDRLVVLGDEEQGIALIKAEVFEERMQEALRAGQKSNE